MAVVLLGVLALGGWQFDVAALKSIVRGQPTTNPVTAVGLIVAGLSLALWSAPYRAPALRQGAAIGAVVAAGAGLVRLADYWFGWDLRLDQWLFPERLGSVEADPSRMGATTALGFAFWGAALLALRRRTEAGRLAAQALSLGTCLLALLALVGYGYGTRSLRGLMAINTAVGFLVLGVGLLTAQPDYGVAGLLRSTSVGGTLARRLLPPVFVIPLALGWLRLEGERAALYDTEGGTALMAIVTVTALLVLTWWSARSLDHADAGRARAEVGLRESEEQFRALATTTADAIIAADHRGEITYFNPGAERIFGYKSDEVRGRPLTLLMPDRFHDTHRAGLARYLATGVAHVLGKTVELAGRRRDGSEFPLELSVATWRQGGDAVFTAIIRDITDRRHAEDARERARLEIERLNLELAQRVAELEAVNRELEAFSYSVSHDLRAPLRSIEGFSQALLDDCAGRLDATGAEHVRRVRAATRRMADLIDDLLDLARVTGVELRRERVDLGALARSVAAELGQRESQRAVEFRCPEGAMVVEGDPRLLRVVLENLLGNAWKFTVRRPQALVEFGVTENGGRRAYFVRDNGAGFDAAYAGKLFGAFQRLHPANEFPGTGIGLATVQRIIHRHGGRVWAEGAVDRGATFHFTLT